MATFGYVNAHLKTSFLQFENLISQLCLVNDLADNDPIPENAPEIVTEKSRTPESSTYQNFQKNFNYQPMTDE